MKKIMPAILLLCALTLPVLGQAETAELDSLKKENAELRARVQRLEAAVAEIRGLLAASPAAAPAGTTAMAAAQTGPPPASEAKTPAQPEKPPVRSKYSVELYGYLKADGAWDSARTNNGNFVQWVESEPATGADPEYNLLVKESRVGLDF
jgi:hypothetical protein